MTGKLVGFRLGEEGSKDLPGPDEIFLPLGSNIFITRWLEVLGGLLRREGDCLPPIFLILQIN